MCFVSQGKDAMKSDLKCNSCHRENVKCVVFVNAKAELTSICSMCLSQALKQAIKELEDKKSDQDEA